MIAAEVLIFIGYVWFAFQCGVFTRVKNEAQKAFAALIAVFVLCAFSGYLVPALDSTFGPLPGWVHVVHLAAHWVLVAATAFLVLTNGARHIREKLSGTTP